MKHLKRIFLTFGLILVFTCVAFAACSPDDSSENNGGDVVPELDRIAVTTPPNKLEYVEGEFFERAGMVVTAYYSDNTSSPALNYTIDKTNALTLDDTVVTITYRQKTTTLTITVNAAPPHEIGPSLTIESDEQETYRVEAEELDSTDWVMKQDFVDAGRSFIESSLNSSKGKSICGFGKGTDILVKVELKTRARIHIVANMSSYNPYNLSENNAATFSGQAVDFQDQTLPEHRTANDYWNWMIVDFGTYDLEAGEHELKLTQNVNTGLNIDYFEFTVSPYGQEEIVLRELVIDHAPNKVEYDVGETFERAGMIVKAIYSNGTEEVIEDYTVSPDGALGVNDTVITVSYGGKTATVTITVKAPASLTGIRVSEQPSRTEYNVGDTFEPAGMVVKSVYDDGTETVIDDYTYSEEALTVDDAAFELTYGEFKAYVSLKISYRLEAETLDQTGWLLKDDFQSAGRTFVESSTGSSGGHSICGLKSGSVITVKLTLKKAAKVQVKANMSAYNPYKLSENNTATFSGQAVDFQDQTLPEHRTANDYWNWMIVDFGTYDLEAGEHELKLTQNVNTGLNIDYFEFTVTPSEEIQSAPNSAAETALPVALNQAFAPSLEASVCPATLPNKEKIS